jgi:hypothetical protein
MRRRAFLQALAGEAITLPLAAKAQQTGKPRTVGVLMTVAESDTDSQKRREFIAGRAATGPAKRQQLLRADRVIE